MLKKSIGIALLCIAGQAYSADIIVTTTEDIEIFKALLVSKKDEWLK